MAAIYTVYPSPSHPPIPNHLPTLIVTPHGQPTNTLYSYLHTNYNTENYLLTPSPQGDLCVAKLFPPRPRDQGKASASDPGHGSSPSRIVKCEASRNLKWSIANTGVISPIYKLSLPSPDSADLPLFQISKPNPNAVFWSMFYFAYAGHNIPPKRIEFGKIQKTKDGTRISITGKSPEEKAVWQTLGEGNEDCVEWVVLCAALNLLDDEIMKAAEKNAITKSANPRGTVALNDNGPLPGNRPPGPPSNPNLGSPPPNMPMTGPTSRLPGPPPNQGGFPSPNPPIPMPGPPPNLNHGGPPPPNMPMPGPPPASRHPGPPPNQNQIVGGPPPPTNRPLGPHPTHNPMPGGPPPNMIMHRPHPNAPPVGRGPPGQGPPPGAFGYPHGHPGAGFVPPPGFRPGPMPTHQGPPGSMPIPPPTNGWSQLVQPPVVGQGTRF